MTWKTHTTHLEKTLTFKSFSEAVTFLEGVARVADMANHHPDVHLHSYNTLTFQLSTHEVESITEKDHALADAIDNLYSAHTLNEKE